MYDESDWPKRNGRHRPSDAVAVPKQPLRSHWRRLAAAIRFVLPGVFYLSALRLCLMNLRPVNRSGRPHLTALVLPENGSSQSGDSRSGDSRSGDSRSVPRWRRTGRDSRLGDPIGPIVSLFIRRGRLDTA